MSENENFNSIDIRPSNFMPTQQELLAIDQERLLIRKSSFLYVECPACCGDNYFIVFEKYGFCYVKCEECGTVYINPRPTVEMIKEYYSISQRYTYWNSHVYPTTEQVRREKIDRPRVKKIIDICSKFNISYGKILEIGPGFGIFADEMKETSNCKEILLIEPNKALADTCRRRGFNIINDIVENVALPKSSYDMIVGFEVFEHLVSQKDFLRKAHLWLVDAGLVVLTCPNINGFDIQMLGCEADVIDNENLTYFNPESIRRLFSDCGFEVLELLTPGQLDADHVRRKVLENKLDISTQSWFKEVLINSWHRVGATFQKFLSDNLLSSHMWVVAQKVSDINKKG